MFTQLFGNYLLEKGVVTGEQLTDAIRCSSETHLKLGTLAIHKGYLTPADVERIYILQTHRDSLFGIIAVDEGYLTDEQVDDLIAMQSPSYLLLGQTLVEEGYITFEEFDNLLQDYKAENKILDLDISLRQKDTFHRLIGNFCSNNSISEDDNLITYLQLLFNDFIRFIGTDFTPLNLTEIDSYHTTIASTQEIIGTTNIVTLVDMDEITGIAFASRYAKEQFNVFDEYCQASLDDFLNLHNGLFLVNLSNERDVELKLNPPMEANNMDYSHSGRTYLLPVIFTFGTVNFVFTVK